MTQKEKQSHDLFDSSEILPDMNYLHLEHLDINPRSVPSMDIPQLETFCGKVDFWGEIGFNPKGKDPCTYLPPNSETFLSCKESII